MANPASLSPPETGAIHDSDAPQSPSGSSLASRSLEEALRRRDGQSSFFRIRPVDQSTPTKRQWGAKVLSSTSSGVSHLEIEFQMFEDVGIHSNIVRVPGLSVRDGMAALVVEAGECSMATFYKNLGYDVPRSTTARLVLEVAKAIKHMHSKNIYHNDLNAENVIIFLGDDGTPTAKLGDLRFATNMWPALWNGTVATAPPETLSARFTRSWFESAGLLNDNELDARFDMDFCRGYHIAEKRDVWGIGMILFQVLFGCVPSLFSSLDDIVYNEKLMKADPRLNALAQDLGYPYASWARKLADHVEDSPFRKVLTSCLTEALCRPTVNEVILTLEALLSPHTFDERLAQQVQLPHPPAPSPNLSSLLALPGDVEGLRVYHYATRARSHLATPGHKAEQTARPAGMVDSA